MDRLVAALRAAEKWGAEIPARLDNARIEYEVAYDEWLKAQDRLTAAGKRLGALLSYEVGAEVG